MGKKREGTRPARNMPEMGSQHSQGGGGEEDSGLIAFSSPVGPEVSRKFASGSVEELTPVISRNSVSNDSGGISNRGRGGTMLRSDT